MNKIKKRILMFIISIIILILSSSTYVFADNKIAEYLATNQDGWFCVQHNTDAASGWYQFKQRLTYRSDSNYEFERAFAYILKSAKESGQNPGLPTNDFRIGLYPNNPKHWDESGTWKGYQNDSGKHQNCLWKLIGEFSEAGKATSPFNDKNKFGTKINYMANNITDTTNVFTSTDAQKIYDAAIAASKRMVSYGTKASIETGDFKATSKIDVGSIKITNLTGTVQNISIEWSDGKKISSNENYTSYFQIYSNEECTQNKSIYTIKQGDTIYIKNQRDFDINYIQIKAGYTGSGYEVISDLYESQAGQNAIKVIQVNKDTSSTATKTIKVLSGKLTVKKQDYDNSTPLNNAKFAIYFKNNSNSGWLGYENNQIKYGKSWNNKYEFVTGKQYCGSGTVAGEFTIKNLIVGEYYVFEIDSPEGYNLMNQPGYTNLRDYGGNGASVVLNGYESYRRGYTIIKDSSSNVFVPYNNYIKYNGDSGWGGRGSHTVTYTIKNKKTKLTIYKQDETYKKDLGVNSDVYLAGAEVKIYARNLKNNSTSQGWIKQVGNKIEYVSYNNATTFKTDSRGKLEIEGILYGDYYIYETKTPSGYDIESQPGYRLPTSSPGASEIRDRDWVFLGNQKVEEQNNDVKATTYNYKYVSLSGRVWVDRPDTKQNNYDNIYKNGSNDILLQGITVNLIDNRTNKVIATTNASGTDRNGEYKFTKKTNGSKLTYWELAYCHVEFTYNDKVYILATPFVGSDVKINSKAKLEEVKTEDLDDRNLKGNGKAITYKGTTSGLSEYSIRTNAVGDMSQRLLTGFYNTSNYTIENINLGLIEKLNAEHSVNEEIEYVKIVRGNYTFTYKYGEDAIIDEQSKKTQSAIAFQNSKRTFTQKIYPSDIKYNLAKENADPECKVYVVYKISVKNSTTHNLPDIYTEQALQLTSLTNQFDTSRYELNKDDLGDEAINSEINRWRISSDSNSTAEYEIKESNRAFKTGIKPNSIESTYIQFKVTQDSLTNLLTKSKDELESIFSRAPTVAKASGYHIYTRKDKNWKNNDTYTHRTVNQDAQDGELFIKWKLASERTISGTVFEDTKVNQLEGEGENSRKNERIGNGYLDIDNNGAFKEKTISDVIVTLMNANTNEAAKLYNGELTKIGDKWKATSQDAIIKVKEDGTYSLPGMIPGRYYLKFTYGNGETEYTDLNGNKIEINTKINGESNPINSNLYKSTILTGNAKNATATNEKSWFIEDIGKNNSVATDKTDIIKNRQKDENKNVELNYSTSQQNAIIDAESPIMDVQFEYVKNPEIAHNEADKLNSNCTGMSFGIIERPHINIELTKKIKNVKITLQDGSNLINANPANQNVDSNLSVLNDANVKIETDKSYIYGSTITVVYSLDAQNKSELDYATEKYYTEGIITEDVKPVTTTVSKVVDYISNKNATYEGQDDNDIFLKDIENEEYFGKDVINANKNYKQSIINIEQDLMPEVANEGKSRTDEFEFTVSNLLSTSDEILGWESYSEIIGIRNITLTPQSICHSGSYIVRDMETSEADDASAIVSLYTSTGENKNLIIYFMVGTGLLVISVGIFIIKKFVI